MSKLMRVQLMELARMWRLRRDRCMTDDAKYRAINDCIDDICGVMDEPSEDERMLIANEAKITELEAEVAMLRSEVAKIDDVRERIIKALDHGCLLC